MELGKLKIVAIVAAITAGVALFLATDWDGDGLPNIRELQYGTSMFNSDTDGDELNDGAELNVYGTDPRVVDSDGDGLNDGAEVNTYDTDPLIVDSDGDGLNDGVEVNTHGTNPTNDDTDGDGLNDGDEINTHGTDPLDADTDDDGLNDGQELNVGADPFDEDTDDDGLKDGSDPHPTTHEWKLIDSDGDGWDDYREYYEEDTDRYNPDTDGDGAPDSRDAHPLSTSRKMARHFEWSYGGSDWTWDLDFSYDLYDYESKEERLMSWAEWSEYTLDPTVDGLATGLAEAADRKGYNYYERAEFALAFVQSQPYEFDINSIGVSEYPKYPLETLVDGEGDCEDSSILYAGILREMGYDVRLLLLSDPGHAAVGVWGHDNYPGTPYTKDGRQYYFCETTGEGWEFGDIPPSCSGKSAYLYSVGSPTSLLSPPAPPTPPDLVVTELSANYVGGSLTVNITVKNQGGTATGYASVHTYYVREGSSYEWYAGYESWSSIGPGESVTATLTKSDMYGSGNLVYVKAIVDKLNFVAESDETNNEVIAYF